jgi:hypothetical protein
MYEFKCDTNQGISFKQTNTKPVGIITHLKIGDTELKVKTKTKDPLEKDAEVVGVLSHVHWEGGEWEPIMLKGLIYDEGADQLWQIKRHKLNNSHISLKFAIYHWEAPVKKEKPYYAAFHHEENLECKISLRPDGALALMVDVNDNTTPGYHPFSIFVSPEKKAMKLHYAGKRGANETLHWGLTHG